MAMRNDIGTVGDPNLVDMEIDEEITQLQDGDMGDIQSEDVAAGGSNAQDSDNVIDDPDANVPQPMRDLLTSLEEISNRPRTHTIAPLLDILTQWHATINEVKEASRAHAQKVDAAEADSDSIPRKQPKATSSKKKTQDEEEDAEDLENEDEDIEATTSRGDRSTFINSDGERIGVFEYIGSKYFRDYIVSYSPFQILPLLISFRMRWTPSQLWNDQIASTTCYSRIIIS